MAVKVEQVALVVLGAGAGIFLWQGMRKAGGVSAPATQGTSENAYTVPDPVQPVLCMPEEHLGEIVFSKHRYPDRVGGSLTTVMHFGHSALAVPVDGESSWISAPPSEVAFL